MLHNQLEDTVLINQLKTGSEEALGALYNRYYIYLVRVATRLCDDAVVAEDLAADAFLKLWHHRSKLGKITSIQAYLTGAVRNLAINYRRRYKKMVHDVSQQEVMLDDTDIEQAYIDAETYRILLEMIAGLPNGEKNVLNLLLEGYTVNDVVKRLQRSQSGVSQSKTEGIRRLRTKLKNYAVQVMHFIMRRAQEQYTS